MLTNDAVSFERPHSKQVHLHVDLPFLQRKKNFSDFPFAFLGDEIIQKGSTLTRICSQRSKFFQSLLPFKR